jgi:CRISPR/Cas system CSM-associated protein Csm4 (group 5 of RAMP superfamily)
MREFFGKQITDEEYDKILEDFRKHIQKEVSYKNIQNERISKFISKLSQEEIESWMDKFLKWENEYEEYCCNVRHIQTDSNIFSALMNYIEQEGKTIRIHKDEDFCACGFKWNKYRFKLYQGQGAFWRIWKGRKVIFTNI